jgi:glycosyltransferase involved in cell wall biosynthesis
MDLSVIVPVYNEEENVGLLFRSIKQVLEKLDKTFEIIFVDDGSKDNTFTALKLLYDSGEPIKVVKFRGNFGQSAAMAAGFETASGDVVISMDGDLQNDPVDIPNLLKKLDEGNDVVSGWRKNRKDKLIVRKVPSKIANKLICSVTQVSLHDTGCSLKVYRKEVIKKIRLYGELHRFIPALAKVEGAKIAEIPVNHHSRKFGKSKYNLTRTFKVLMDLTTLNLLLKYLKRPLHFFGFFSIISILISGGIGLWILYYLFNNASLADLNILWTMLFLFTVTGFQFLFMGLLANLIVNTGQRKSFYLTETQNNEPKINH